MERIKNGFDGPQLAVRTLALPRYWTAPRFLTSSSRRMKNSLPGDQLWGTSLPYSSMKVGKGSFLNTNEHRFM
jgi:hypothetical protein